MKRILFALSLFVAAPLCSIGAEASEPIGYIISYTVKDSDTTEGGVLRKGKEIPAKVWMPLEFGDVVFVRKLQGQITVDLKGTGRLDIPGHQKRLELEEAPRQDDSWDLYTQLVSVFTSDAEVPVNLVSKGGDLAVPMAVQGANMIVRDGRPLWIAWNGSRGPYSITADIEGNRQAIATQDETELSMAIPSGVRQRFVLIVSDSLGKQARLIFRLRNKAPDMPAAMRKEAALHDAETAVAAGWLAAQGNGEWRFEAARMLRAMPEKDDNLSGLLAALAAGWRPAISHY